MKPVLTRNNVEKAIESLIAAGKKPTVVAIHAALGHKGSMTTLCKLKAEIDAEGSQPQDPEAATAAFRNLWNTAVNEGRQQREAEIAELKSYLDAVMAESQAMEGEVAAANARIKEFEALQAGIATQLEIASQQVTAARASGEQQATKLAEALERIEKLQTAHASEIARLREQLADAQAKAHDLELKLARAEARLDMSGQASAPASDQPRSKS